MFKWLLSCFVVFISCTANATSVFMPNYYSKSCKIFVTGPAVSSRVSINDVKPAALVFYLDELNKKYFQDSAYIIVSFENGYNYDTSIRNRSSKYQISYCTPPSYISCNNGKEDSWDKPALILSVLTSHVSYTDLFKLVYYALNNVNETSGNNELYIEGEEEINKILALNIYPDFKDILDNVFYRSWLKSSDDYGNIDYFIQNDSFYIYKKGNSKEKTLSFYSWGLREEFLTPRNEHILASFQNLNYVASDGENNMLVVDSDTTFYWYSLEGRSLKGPFLLSAYSFKEEGFFIDSFSVIARDSIKLFAGTYFGHLELFFNTDKHIYTVDSANSKRYVMYSTAVAEKELREKALQQYLIDKAEKEQRQNLIKGVLSIAIVAIFFIPLFIAGYKQLKS